MRFPGKRPGPLRRVVAVGAVLASAAAAGALSSGIFGAAPVSASSTTTTTTNPWVPGINGTMTVGIDEAPTGCNPNTSSGDTWADRLVLEPVLPSAFVVNGSDQAVYDSALITQAELQSTTPETVVYTINPKAVWSDGKPVTADDFIYTWDQERGVTGAVGSKATASKTTSSTTTTTTPSSSTTTSTTSSSTTTTGSTATTAPSSSTAGSSTPSSGSSSPTQSSSATPGATTTALPGATGTTGPAVGYRQIQSVTSSNDGRTVTVVFKTPYADWQSLFDDLLPANVMEKTGWNPSCSTVDPAIDLSAGPFEIAKATSREVVLDRNPRWWQSQPALSRIVIRIATSPTQLSQWLTNGTVDVALPMGYSDSYLESVTDQPSDASQSQVSTTFLELEMSTTSTATASLDVREAVAHAIDRETLVQDTVGWADTTIVPGESFLASQSQSSYTPHKPAPPQVTAEPGSTSSTTSSTPKKTTTFPLTADLATTSKLLSDLGYYKDASGHWYLASGKVFTLRLAIDAGDSWAAAAGADIVHQLEAAGITVTQTTETNAQATGEALSSGAADIALLPLHSSPYPSQAIGWYTTLLGTPGSGGSQDWSNLDDPTVNGLLEKASQELNPVDATPIYAQADAALWQDMPGLPLFAQPSLTAWSGLTSGVSANANGPSLLWSAQNWAMRVPPTSKDTESS